MATILMRRVAGQRTAVNLSGVKKKMCFRGSVASCIWCRYCDQYARRGDMFLTAAIGRY